VYIGEAADGGFQAGDLLVSVGTEDCLETNALAVEAKIARQLNTQNQAHSVCSFQKIV
jgi:hypothetical protein